jgi:hypothetical protein
MALAGTPHREDDRPRAAQLCKREGARSCATDILISLWLGSSCFPHLPRRRSLVPAAGRLEMFKFTLYIAAFILSFGLCLAYLTGFQRLAPAPVQQAEQHPLVGVPPEHAAAGQAMASAAQLSAPGSPSSAPAVNFNDLSGKYRECVLEKINALQSVEEAAEERSATRGLSWRHLQMIAPLLHYDPEAAEMARQANFMRIKETCRLKFPCADGETVSDDYNSCRKS